MTALHFQKSVSSHLEAKNKTKDPFNWVRKFPVGKEQKCEFLRTFTLKNSEKQVSI